MIVEHVLVVLKFVEVPANKYDDEHLSWWASARDGSRYLCRWSAVRDQYIMTYITGLGDTWRERVICEGPHPTILMAGAEAHNQMPSASKAVMDVARSSKQETGEAE